MISGHDVLYFSSVDWGFLWQGPQEIAVRLGAAQNRVLFVENTGVRAPRVEETGRVARRLVGWAQSVGQVREVAPNVHVYSPLVLPPFGPPWRRRINRNIFAAQLRYVMGRMQFHPSLLWTYLPTDTTEDAIRLFRPPGAPVVYYCVADFRELVRDVPRMEHSENGIVAASDAVFTNCAALAARFSPLNRNVHVFPFGVDLRVFADNAAEPHPGLSSLPRPIVGYVGGLPREVELDLLLGLAEARPSWSWVYVGSVQRDLGKLASFPNVHLIGARPHRELPAYIRAFDVCTVPYRHSPFTNTVVPTKINEYLALGKPVVATDLPTICEFNETHGVLTTAPPRLPEFLAALEAVLQVADQPAAVARRKQVAAQADWTTRLDQMLALVEDGKHRSVPGERDR
jgi:glycosyltransferase involved in cell wall biosynthesis